MTFALTNCDNAIENSDSNLYPVKFENNKWGFINDNGETVIKPIYEKAYFYENDLAIVGRNNKVGLIDKDNSIVIEIKYDYISIFNKNLIVGMIDHHSYFINLEQDLVIHYEYETVGLWNDKTFIMVDTNHHIIFLNIVSMNLVFTEFEQILIPRKSFFYGQKLFAKVINPFYNLGINEEYAIIISDNKLGYIKFTGEIISEPKYDYVMYFQNNIGIVKLDNKWGLIDSIGNTILPPKYDAIFKDVDFVNDSTENLFDFVKSKNFHLERLLPEDIAFHEGLTKVRLNNKWGFIDTLGNEIIKPEYDDVGHFSQGFAVVKNKDKYGCIDKNGKELIPVSMDYMRSFSNGLALVKNNDKYIYYNFKGEKVLGEYDEAEDFVSGHAVVNLNGNYFIIDTSGKFVIEPKYHKIKSSISKLFYKSNNYYYKTLLNWKQGYINKNYKIIIEADKYDNILDYGDDIFIVTQNGKDGLVDTAGKEILAPEYDRIYEFNKGIALIDYEGEKYYVNKKGKIIFGPVIDVARTPDISTHLNHSYLVEYKY